MIIGRILKYEEENINTDVIWPGKYTYLDIPVNEMINYVFENHDPDFKNKISFYDVLVVGKNFGCGSSREQPATALRAAGVKAIIAPSFARIFYRNAINQGLPVIVSQEIFNNTTTGDEISLSLEEGIAILYEEKKSIQSAPQKPIIFQNKPFYGGAQTTPASRTSKIYHIPNFPDFLMKIINAGGLVNYARMEENV